MGEVLQSLTPKCISRTVRCKAYNVLTPLQVGVGVSMGCKAITHSVNYVHKDTTISPDEKWTLLLDLSNAFSSISREMFEEVRAKIPSISSWAECCYSSQHLLHMENHNSLSKCGVQQGDPLGPLAFYLALHPII